MRIQKRLSAVLLTLLLSCALVLTTTLAYAAAANPLPDPDWSRNGSCGIGVRMLYNGKTVPGGSLELYKVGDVEGNQKTFTLNNDFSGMDGVSLGDFATEQSARLAQSLANYANRRHLMPLKTADIDENGYAEFNDLAFGLYLVVQDEHARGYEAIDPFLVSLPMYTAGEGYDYFINAEPKVDKPNPPSPGGSSSNPASEPGSSEPTSSEPTSSEPTSSQPESSEPTSSEPTSSQPESSQTGSQPAGGSTPGGTTPGGNTPGGNTPGGNTPGGTTPGGNTPGGGTTPGGGSSTPTLPQTGQLNWPIPGLVVAGLSLILVGWGVNYNSKSRKSHEA